MKYEGIIQKSRTIDLAVLSGICDMLAATFILYTPAQIGISVPVYLMIRMGLSGVAIYLRHQTKGPVGQK